MKNCILALTLLLTCAFQLHSQNLELGIRLNPGFSGLSGDNSFMDTRRVVNSLGVVIKKPFGKQLSFHSGLILLQQGAFDFGVWSGPIYIPESFIDYEARSIAVPINLAYNFYNKKRVRLTWDMGFIFGRVISESGTLKGMAGNYDHSFTRTPIYYNHGLAVSIRVSDHLNIELRPSFKAQVFTSLTSFEIASFDLGMNYMFLDSNGEHDNNHTLQR